MTEQDKPTSFWIFDENRRVYAKDPKTGRSTGGPIWIEHWVARKVEGETSRSWIVGDGWNERKIPKRGPWPMPGVCRTRAEVEALAWVHDTRAEIALRADEVHRATPVQVVQMAGAFGIEAPDHVRAQFSQWWVDQEGSR